MKRYLTTPIYYVNDVPHIGHAYCTLATDVFARYWRKEIGCENVYFVTGTDENSQKTVEAAERSGKSIPEYLEEMSQQWKETWTQCGVSFDDFIRTTEPRHIRVVHSVLQKIYEAGDIYKGTYIGQYCSGCETFLKTTDLDENGHCPAHKKPPQQIEEENYFFRLSKYQDILLQWYAQNSTSVVPDKRQNEVLRFIESGLEDISISRENAEFGIPLPWDETHKIYVWFDALLNYRTALPKTDTESFWNGVTHVLGKDITKFHCIIWPAMLLSSGYTLPQQMVAHGFFTVDGVKMSKSLGNVVSPVELSQKYGNDALRVGLLSSFEFGNDGDFSLAQFHDLYQKKLAGGIGNLFHRVLVLSHKFLEGKKPPRSSVVDTKKFLTQFSEALESYKLKTAYDLFFHIMDCANERLNETEVWKLAKVDMEQATLVFSELTEYLELLAECAEILLPESAQTMKTLLGDSDSFGVPVHLFDRVD